MHRSAACAALVAFAAFARCASALIYLPENTLESLLVRADGVAIATVGDVDESKNTGTLQIEDALKGNVSGRLAVTGIMLRIDTNKRKARFAKGDRIVVFLGPATDGTRAILHAQTLEDDTEVRTMKGCIPEITPVAQTLADLGDPKKEIAIEPLRKALTPLVSSKNAYTQILVGRLMSTRLAAGVKPESWADVLTVALSSKRPELLKGALAWAGKYERLPEDIKSLVEKLAKDADDKSVRDAAEALLKNSSTAQMPAH